MSKSKYLTIQGDTINTENIDYLNTKTAQKPVKKENSEETENVDVYIISIVYNSGVQVAIPFEKEEVRDRVHKVILDQLGSNRILM